MTTFPSSLTAFPVVAKRSSFLDSSVGRECICNARRHRFKPWVEKIPWRRKWLPTPAFLLKYPMDRGACQVAVQRVAKVSDTTEHKTRFTHYRRVSL